MQSTTDTGTIQLPKRARQYILYQRTKIDLQTIFGALCAKIAQVLPALYHPLVKARAAYHGAWIDTRFNALMQADYESIREYLPVVENPRIVDIGCGIAGIDVLLSQHYAHTAKFVLVDKTQIDAKIHYGFKTNASFYNNLSLAKEVLVRNGTDAGNVRLMTPEEFIADPPAADIVISLESWGFHYPLSTYMKTVKQSISSGGTIIVELRKGSGELEQLHKECARVQLVSDTKRQRAVCVVQ